MYKRFRVVYRTHDEAYKNTHRIGQIKGCEAMVQQLLTEPQAIQNRWGMRKIRAYQPTNRQRY